MIPTDLIPLPPGILPPLSDAEFVLEQNPRSQDPVVAAFAGILRDVAPLIIKRLAEEQIRMISQGEVHVTVAAPEEAHRVPAGDREASADQAQQPEG